MFLQVSILRTVIVKLIVASKAGNCAIVKLLDLAGAIMEAMSTLV